VLKEKDTYKFEAAFATAAVLLEPSYNLIHFQGKDVA